MSAHGLPPLLEPTQALQRILAAARPVADYETLALVHALDRVAAVDVTAAVDVPPGANSAMDGYAVAIADELTRARIEAGLPLPVRQRIPAGSAPGRLERGEAARIFTGAELPAGADSVVIQEDTVADDEGVVVRSMPLPGDHVRPRGQDIAAGAPLLCRGDRLDPARLGLLASAGLARVDVFRRLRGTVLTSGDELVRAGEPLAAGQIYNSSACTLPTLLHRLGCEVAEPAFVEDSAAATEAALGNACRHSDFVITTGGVSVGDEDHVRHAIERLGRLDLWRIAMRPGKPLAFGIVDGTPVLGLPGNPVSSFVTFVLFVRPFILRMQGLEAVEPRRLSARLGVSWQGGGREEYLRVRLQRQGDGLVAEPYPNQSSGVLSSVAWADALAVVPPSRTLAVGDVIDVLLLDDLTR